MPELLMPEESPRKTKHIDRWLKVSGLLGDDLDVTAFVTATEWGQIAEELKHPDYEATTIPTNRNFSRLRVAKNLLVVNSGSEDQRAINIINQRLLGPENERMFEWRRDNLITGKLDHFTTDRTLVYPWDMDFGAEIVK